MIRVAAVGDVHVGPDSAGELSSAWANLDERADLLLLAGDLTRTGDPAEATVLAKELSALALPKVAVLGNHDYHHDQERAITEVLQEASVSVLEASSVSFDINGTTIGVAGAKGFGGGFAGACATEFGEPEMKAFVRHSKEAADKLGAELGALGTDLKVALLHYSPVEATLAGERLEIYPFLGSYLLAQAIDHAGCDLVLHGHAHGGVERGMTPGGVPVRNVALPVIHHGYTIFCLGGTDVECETE